MTTDHILNDLDGQARITFPIPLTNPEEPTQKRAVHIVAIFSKADMDALVTDPHAHVFTQGDYAPFWAEDNDPMAFVMAGFLEHKVTKDFYLFVGLRTTGTDGMYGRAVFIASTAYSALQGLTSTKGMPINWPLMSELAQFLGVRYEAQSLQNATTSVAPTTH